MTVHGSVHTHSPNTNTENQRRFIEAKKEQGLQRLILWVRPEDVEPLKEIARQPHAIAKRRAKVRAEIERELRPTIKAKVAAQLERKTQRATSGGAWPRPCRVGSVRYAAIVPPPPRPPLVNLISI